MRMMMVVVMMMMMKLNSKSDPVSGLAAFSFALNPSFRLSRGGGGGGMRRGDEEEGLSETSPLRFHPRIFMLHVTPSPCPLDLGTRHLPGRLCCSGCT